MTTKLVDTNGNDVSVQEGESCDLISLFAFDGASINKAAILTLTLTLYDKSSGSIINTRDGQDVLDLNGGTVATDGTLTMKLDASDNVIVGASVLDLQSESHIARYTWTWQDGDGDTRTGVEEFEFRVEKLKTTA